MPAPKRPIAWSYSAITSFENCPRKYYEVNIAKSVKDGNETTDTNKIYHDALDARIARKKPLPGELAHLEPYAALIIGLPGETYSEADLTINEQFVPTKFNDWDGAWLRVRADVLKINGASGIGFDHKFGKPRNDADQAELTALTVFRRFPSVQHFRFIYAHLDEKKGRDLLPFDFRADQQQALWGGWMNRYARLKAAREGNNFPMTPNPLCAYCPVRQCPNYRGS